MSARIGATKSYRDRLKGIREGIEKKAGKSAEELCAEREKRMSDAIALRLPDRVPVTIQTGVFAAKYAGIPLSAMYYDHAAYREACLKTVLDFEPDTGASMMLVNSGLVMELLDVKHQRWPGGNLDADTPYQFVEGEYMKAEEYDLFLDDPSDFIFRYYLPRNLRYPRAGYEVAPFPHHDRRHGFYRAAGGVHETGVPATGLQTGQGGERTREGEAGGSGVFRCDDLSGVPLAVWGAAWEGGASGPLRSIRYRTISGACGGRCSICTGARTSCWRPATGSLSGVWPRLFPRSLMNAET